MRAENSFLPELLKKSHLPGWGGKEQEGPAELYPSPTLGDDPAGLSSARAAHRVPGSLPPPLSPEEILLQHGIGRAAQSHISNPRRGVHQLADASADGRDSGWGLTLGHLHS